MNQIGLIGLGKMGFHLALNLQGKGFEVVAYDVEKENIQKLLTTAAAHPAIVPAWDIPGLCRNLKTTKVIWLMIPAGEPVDVLIRDLLPSLATGDILIDGGNSFYKDSVRRYNELKAQGIRFLDCGTSGGLEGALQGACTMVGGDKEIYDFCEPLLKAVSVDQGVLYCGKAGSGHFVKMVHNGIEYGMMQSIAEGFEVLASSAYSLDLEAVAGVWNHGSVVRSWLMELTQRAFGKDPGLVGIEGKMRSSGEGKWTLETALEMGIPTPVIALSVLMRYRSLQEDTFAGKVVAALRDEFGGHGVVKKEKDTKM